MPMTTVLHLKLGESKNVSRIWMEGEKLAKAGVRVGARYSMAEINNGRIVLREAGPGLQGQAFTVSKRDRRGVLRPLMEIRSNELGRTFAGCEKVKVAIRSGRIVITASHVDAKRFDRSSRLIEKLRLGQPLEVCSVFHGGGILDKAVHHGMLRAGVSTAVRVAVEVESNYLEASLRNNPELWHRDAVAVCSDVRDVDWSNGSPSCELLIGGIPCTGASKSGRAKNQLLFAEEHNEAGALFVSYLDAVRAVNPAVVIAENVPEYQSTASMAVVRSVLQSLGYRLHETILDGAGFGCLERRRRLVIVAVCASLPNAFDFSLLQSIKDKEASVAAVLESVPADSPRWKHYAYLAEKAIRDKAAKKGFARQLLTGAEDGCGTIGRHYAKCRSTEPFLQHPTNPQLSRLFTPTEHARLKGIPAEVIQGEAETTAHEMLGQAVIYPKFEAVGFEVGRSLRAACETLAAPCTEALAAA